MTNVTADTIALEMAGDRVAAIPRGRLAAEVHEAREKLISSAPSRHAFDVELLRLSREVAGRRPLRWLA
jgi:hypothetical protein